MTGWSGSGYGPPLARNLSLASFVAAAVLIAAPGSAWAATQIGQTGVPDAFCDDNDNIVQSATAGPSSYAVPAGGGVITSWSFQAAAGGSMGKMIVFRPTVAADQFIVVGKTDPQTFTAAVQTFATRITVQAGDLLGMRMTAPSPDGAFCLLSTPSVGDQIRFNTDTPEPPDGSTQTLNNNLSNLTILVAAALEPDADNDGFGDETQDNCVGTPGTANGCPSTVTIDKLKQKGDTKIKLTATVPGAGTLKVGSSSDPALASSAAKKSLKAVTKTLTATTKQQVKLTLKLTKSAIGKLDEAGNLKVNVKAVYTPVGGPAGSQTKKKKLKT